MITPTMANEFEEPSGDESDAEHVNAHAGEKRRLCFGSVQPGSGGGVMPYTGHIDGIAEDGLDEEEYNDAIPHAEWITPTVGDPVQFDFDSQFYVSMSAVEGGTVRVKAMRRASTSSAHTVACQM